MHQSLKSLPFSSLFVHCHLFVFSFCASLLLKYLILFFAFARRSIVLLNLHIIYSLLKLASQALILWIPLHNELCLDGDSYIALTAATALEINVQSHSLFGSY